MTDSQKEVIRPEPEDYRLLVEREWADVHHSRIQEWSALGVVTGAHLGILQLMLLLRDLPVPVPVPLTSGPVLGIVFAVIGSLITCRHRRLMAVKMNWIYQAEYALGLVKDKENPEKTPGGIIPSSAKMKSAPGWRGLTLPRPFATSGLILFLYLSLIVLDIFSITLFANL